MMVLSVSYYKTSNCAPVLDCTGLGLVSESSDKHSPHIARFSLKGPCTVNTLVVQDVCRGGPLGRKQKKARGCWIRQDYTCK